MTPEEAIQKLRSCSYRPGCECSEMADVLEARLAAGDALYELVKQLNPPSWAPSSVVIDDALAAHERAKEGA